MPKDKERSVNPAQQQRKLEKAKALKKGRAELQTRRNEKLARRNPERMQREIDDLKALEAKGDLKSREKTILEELEKDLRAVRKVRDALGEKAPQYGHRQPPRREGGDSSTVLGKRRHDGERQHFPRRHQSSGSDTDDSAKRIPMPEDTPPPIPREHRRYFKPQSQDHPHRQHQQQPIAEVKATYSAAPQVRNLKQEAIKKFVPDVVRRKQQAAGGTAGRLMEPEEMDRLEAEGYVKAEQEKRDEALPPTGRPRTKEDELEAKRLADEEERFRREMEMENVEADPDMKQDISRRVQIEEVDDEDG